jgi:hypothetical protein
MSSVIKKTVPHYLHNIYTTKVVDAQIFPQMAHTIIYLSAIEKLHLLFLYQ